MELRNNLTVNLSQKLVLTQKMKLSLKILQMNLKDLNEFIEKEQENNILMHVEKFSVKGKSYKVDEYDPYSMVEIKETSFYDFLYTQIGEEKLDKKMREICEYIIDNIDSRGYLSHWIRHPYNQFDFEKGLEIVRSLEPRGVGGDDLKGCLLLQLDEDEIYEKIIVEDYLEELAYGDKRLIAKEMKISLKKLLKVIERIRDLNPIPSKGYYIEEKRENFLPDAFINIVDEKIEVEMNLEVIPNILIEQSELPICDDKYKEYLKKCKTRAELIIDCIKQRQMTLEKVIKEVVKSQREYFFNGELKPLTLLDIADNLGIHQSTVSRAIKGRYISTKGSVVPLKIFFAKQFRPKDINREYKLVTRESIKNKIYEIIMTEDKKTPYSDSKIVKILELKQIKISRRTVTKYREEMRLLSSSKRKRK